MYLFSKIKTLDYFLNMKGVSTPNTFFRFSAVDCLSPLCLSMPPSYNVYNDNTHINAKWLAEARGGVSLKKTFPVTIRFNYKKNAFFHQNLKCQKKIITSYGS